jgi:hypothetical protein
MMLPTRIHKGSDVVETGTGGRHSSGVVGHHGQGVEGGKAKFGGVGLDQREEFEFENVHEARRRGYLLRH